MPLNLQVDVQFSAALTQAMRERRAVWWLATRRAAVLLPPHQ